MITTTTAVVVLKQLDLIYRKKWGNCDREGDEDATGQSATCSRPAWGSQLVGQVLSDVLDQYVFGPDRHVCCHVLMIAGWYDYRNNVNMFYIAGTMWSPMGIFMLVTMPGMFPNRSANLMLCILFACLTAASLWASRNQTLVDNRQFIASMIPHHSGAILMCREATLADMELKKLCDYIMKAQREEIETMNSIRSRL